MKQLIFLLSALAGAQIMPPAATPGALNTSVTQANISVTVCAAGWTATVRPPASYTTHLKIQQMAARHLHGVARAFEEDHRVPLELGGHPRDPRNLWPEPWARPYGAHEKDRLENAVKRDVCAGVITLATGRAIFLGNFWLEYRRRFEH